MLITFRIKHLERTNNLSLIYFEMFWYDIWTYLQQVCPTLSPGVGPAAVTWTLEAKQQQWQTILNMMPKMVHIDAG